MARRKAREEDSISCTFVFDGTLQSRVRGTLVIELIKYLLYERQQIPLPIDYVKQELKRISESQLGNEQNGGRKPKCRQLNRLELKRATNTVKNFDELSSHVMQVFEICPEIHQVLLMFGGTSVSPKESYLVNLPGINPEAEGLPSENLCKISVPTTCNTRHCRWLQANWDHMLESVPSGSKGGRSGVVPPKTCIPSTNEGEAICNEYLW